MTHFYSAESVTAGHPDKLCDQIADTVLDGCLTLDRNARVACEVLATKGHIVLAGEISTTVMPDLGKLTREALENAGYNPKDFEIESLIHPQSPDIEAAVNDPLDAESDPNAIGAGDQCVVVGYESLPYHNCVFVGRDAGGAPRYAALRGTYTYGKQFKGESTGSDKRFGFCIEPTEESNTVSVFEAAIDAMAEMTLAGNAADKYRLSLGGIYAPEEGRDIHPPAALEEFLHRHPQVNRIEFCLDNDPPGRAAAAALARLYGERYQVAVRLPPIEGFDYGDLAQAAMEYRTKAKAKSCAIRQSQNNFPTR